MTTPQTTTDPRLVPPTADQDPGTVRRTIIASALAVAATAEVVVLLAHPWEERNEFGYTQLAPIRDATWWTLVADAVALAVVGLSLSLVVCRLARSRGAVLANVGAVAATLGGILFAMGGFAFAALTWYATDTAALSPESGTTLLTHVVDNPTHVLGPQMAGFLLFTVGSVLLSVALLRARSVPRWIPAGVLLLTVGTFLPVPSRVLDLVQAALMAVLIVLAWTSGRHQQ
jgi:hypothetical protein